MTSAGADGEPDGRPAESSSREGRPRGLGPASRRARGSGPGFRRLHHRALGDEARDLVVAEAQHLL